MRKGDPTVTVFPLRMSGMTRVCFYVAVAACAAVTAWGFASGHAWTGICMAAVGLPMTLLFWYMLHVLPSRAAILVEETAVRLSAPPFLEEAVPFDRIDQISPTRLDRETEFFPTKTEQGTHFGSYRTGRFALKNGREATVMADSRNVVAVKTADRLYLLGPTDLEGLTQALPKRPGLSLS